MLKRLKRASLRRFYNFCLKTWSWQVSKNHDIHNTVVISGAPRSGTTWLFEILLGMIPRSFGLYEPLHLVAHKRLQKLGFSWRQYIAPGQRWREAEKLFTDILCASKIDVEHVGHYLWRDHQGRLDVLYKLADVLYKLAKADTYIVKFCRANRLLKWMVETYAIKSPILLIRHPCAVVSSQLTSGYYNLEQIRTQLFSIPEVFKEVRWINELAQRVSTVEEQFAFVWCLDYYIPLSEPKPHPWILTTYEKLVTEGETELNRLLGSLGYEAKRDPNDLLKRPSAEAHDDSNVARGQNPLTTWRRRLNRTQQDRVLSVVAEFGLDFYSKELEPDYERLTTDPLKTRNKSPI